MKTILSYLLFIFLSSTFTGAKEIALDRKIPSPDSIKFFSNPDESTLAFKKLLKEGKIGEFYTQAYTELLRMGQIRFYDITENELKKQIWLFYLISAAPLYDYDTILEQTKDEEGYNVCKYKEEDLKAKKYALRILSLDNNNIKKLSKMFSVPLNELSSLMPIYCGKTLRSISNYFVPGRWLDLISREVELTEGTTEEERYISRLKLVMESNRQGSAQSILEMQSKPYLYLLISFFPKKANEVKKYLLLAGIKEEDIPDFIDETIGRNAETEFLYKGRKAVDPKKKKEKKKSYMRLLYR